MTNEFKARSNYRKAANCSSCSHSETIKRSSGSTYGIWCRLASSFSGTKNICDKYEEE